MSPETHSTSVRPCAVIDVNVVLGPEIPVSRSFDVHDLLALQRDFEIGHSLVRHSSAVRVSRTLGNRRAIEAAEHASVSSVATATLLHGSSLSDELHAATRAGARAIRIEGVSWASSSPAVVRLLETTMASGLPLMVPSLAPGDAAAIGRLTAGEGRPVVIVDARYPDFSEIIPALEEFENLYLETSSLGSYRALESVASLIGHERILFGTGAPRTSPRSPLNAITASDLTSDQVQAILGGNAQRVFGIDAPLTRPAGFKAPVALLDVHGHFFPCPWEVPDQAPVSLLSELSHYGIRAQVASSVPAIMGDLDEGNAQTVDACAQTTGQFGYLVAEPRDLVGTEEQIRKWGDSEGILGVKVHAESSATPTSSPAMASLFAVLADYGKPVKIHNWESGWDGALLTIAQRYPRLPIIIAHAGFHAPQRISAAVVNEAENVYIELSSSKADIREARDLVAAVPVERVLFGSDAPLLNPAFVIGTFQQLGLSDEDLAAVYWRNAAALFEIDI